MLLLPSVMQCAGMQRFGFSKLVSFYPFLRCYDLGQTLRHLSGISRAA